MYIKKVRFSEILLKKGVFFLAFLGQGFPFRYFSAREKDSYIRKKNPKNSRARPKMPPTRTVLPMLSWAKKGGQLTTHARGVVFGMHTAGMSALAIADRMGMTPNGVRAISQISGVLLLSNKPGHRK